jgi:hypothetical protein
VLMATVAAASPNASVQTGDRIPRQS